MCVNSYLDHRGQQFAATLAYMQCEVFGGHSSSQLLALLARHVVAQPHGLPSVAAARVLEKIAVADACLNERADDTLQLLDVAAFLTRVYREADRRPIE